MSLLTLKLITLRAHTFIKFIDLFACDYVEIKPFLVKQSVRVLIRLYLKA